MRRDNRAFLRCCALLRRCVKLSLPDATGAEEEQPVQEEPVLTVQAEPMLTVQAEPMPATDEPQV